MKPSQGVSFLDQGLRYLRKITEQSKSPNSSAVRLNHPGNRGYLNSETGAILTFPVSKIIASSRYGGNMEMVDWFLNHEISNTWIAKTTLEVVSHL